MGFPQILFSDLREPTIGSNFNLTGGTQNRKHAHIYSFTILLLYRPWKRGVVLYLINYMYDLYRLILVTLVLWERISYFKEVEYVKS